MREIKFKSFDKKMGWHSVKFTMENLKELLEDDNNVVCQFTGLQDKNGKEAYTGDKDEFGNTIGYSAPSYCLISESGYAINPLVDGDFIITGNIHEK